ncbi:velvet factor-domain-containing protein [Chaetomium sp. MPI-CAGE-AT-0009]|nr:velvet factor-domain-containing protein [Chaetomium sp. MPI-CAGE-AT-0009]
MSAAVDFAHHNFGRRTHLDGMAQHHSYHEPYAPGNGHYGQEQQFQQPPQARQLPRLPPMATMIPTAASNPSPVLSNGRDTPYYGGRSSYYSDYATPSPVGQTPPQLPIPNSDPHPMSKRALDIRHSPTLSSTASDRSNEEIAHDLRLRQMSTLNDPHNQGSIPRQPIHYPSPRSRGGSLQHDMALPPVLAKIPSGTSYSSSSVIPNGRPPAPQLPRSPPSTQPSTSPRQEPKSMSISNLLSGGSSSNNNNNNNNNNSAATTTATNSTSPNGTTPQHQPLPPTSSSAPPPRTPTSEHRITVRQQPSAARSCGFGERDRRVIDPPPIVQLTIHDDGSLGRDEVSRRLRHQFSVVHCSIWDDKGQRDMSSMPEDFRQQRRLMGTLVASPFVGLDEKGEEGCFFCFPDLSCRTPGVFRLKFALVVLDPARMCSGDRSAIVATAMSESFQVYNAKDFPGMQASTLLTKRLKEQGCLISIKKGNEKREAGGGAGGSGRGEEDEDDEDGGEGEEGDRAGELGGGGEGKGRGRKRVKR